jgi:ribosome recycling factor
MEEMEFIVDAAKECMEQAVVHLEKEMLNIRAGKANPIMLSSVKVDYYGTPTLISQVANVNSPDGRTLTVQPWEKGMLQEIEKAILAANLGFNPMNNGESIIINIPPLTEERRRDLAKLAKAETENAKIGVRAARKEANGDIKKSDSSIDIQKNYEIDVQQLTDTYISKIDEIFNSKEKEILTV